MASIAGIRRPNITLGWLEARRFRIQAPRTTTSCPRGDLRHRRPGGWPRTGHGELRLARRALRTDFRSRRRREKRNLSIALRTSARSVGRLADARGMHRYVTAPPATSASANTAIRLHVGRHSQTRQRTSALLSSPAQSSRCLWRQGDRRARWSSSPEPGLAGRGAECRLCLRTRVRLGVASEISGALSSVLATASFRRGAIGCGCMASRGAESQSQWTRSAAGA